MFCDFTSICVRSNNRDVISGHGTLGLEIINQLPQVDAIVLPVAQGALLAGVCVAVKTMFPTVQIIVSLITSFYIWL